MCYAPFVGPEMGKSACRKMLLTLVILWPKSIFVKMSEIIFEAITSEVLTINTGTLGACYV